MAVACPLPDPNLGVALRLSTYLDCQARALGENGFQALAGGPVATGLLLALVTIFVALIGYRLILGQTPALRDGVSWTVRLGVVLALVTSWPAFQTLVYRVAVDGPGELAAVLLPASALPSDNLEARVQTAYDTMRRLRVAGANQALPDETDQSQAGAPPQSAPQSRAPGFTPLSPTISGFVITTIGVTAAFRVAVGFLLAIGPIAILALLFDATLGLFSGWVRALAGATLGGLAATIVTALDLVAVESELASLQAYSTGGSVQAIDPQALATIVLLFGIVTFVVSIAAVRATGAFRLSLQRARSSPEAYHEETVPLWRPVPTPLAVEGAQSAAGVRTGMLAQPRAAAIADALTATLRREQVANNRGGDPQAPSRRMSIAEAAARTGPAATAAPLGATGRRSTARRTRLAARRDRAT